MKRTVQVCSAVTVEVDESKFTEEFLREFRQYMFPFFDVKDHIEHLASLYARGVIDNGDFIEGYGDADEFGIKFRTSWTESEFRPDLDDCEAA